MLLRFCTALLLCPLLVYSATDGLTPAENQLLDTVHANTLKAHISFLASDLLEGRDTPSRGLDLAAEYIAAQFRRFGLEPAVEDGSYFQVAPYLKITQPMENFRVKLELADGKGSWESTGPKVMAIVNAATQATNLDVVKVSISSEDSPLPAKEAIRGKAVVVLLSQRTPGTLARRETLFAMEPAVVLTPGFTSNQPYRLREAGPAPSGAPPVVVTSDSAFSKTAGELAEGPTTAKLTIHIPAPVEEAIQLRNVIAKLPGSDAALQNQYILLTAHYDHIGLLARADGDRINNGANDDASGVSTVLTLAEAFSSRKVRPKRTLVFMTYFGEEKGLLGSKFYAAHPVFPLKDTVANLNFEHMGRTDDNEGDRKGKVTASGFDYTTIGSVLVDAGKATGIEAWGHEKNSDAFFSRSDNQALADSGVPALTVCVAWIFPDYHRPGDHWEKIDYSNMQSVVRTMALTVQRIANEPKAPAWVETHAKVGKYVKAYRTLHNSQ